MIAKRITSRAAKPRMARLVKYMVAAEGKLDPRSWTRTADYMLASAISTRGEKVGGVRVTNCHTDDPAAATTLIEATQAANTRSKTEKTYHLVFSFPPGEEPPLEILHKIEDELVRSIGYAEHQRVSAVHIDCDHLHVHVAINKVHPRGFQNIEPYFDKKKLMEACERLELELGLQRTNHGLTGQEPKSKMKERQAQAEAHSGMETLSGHVSREIVPKLKEAKTWNEAHAILAEHGLEIKKRGSGLVIGSGNLWVKASACDRALSLKSLSDRLGPYAQSVRSAAHGVHHASRTPPLRPAYEAKPLQQHPSSALLFDQYQREREVHRINVDHGIERIKYEGAMLEYQLRKWHVAQSLIAKAGFKGPQRRLALKVVNIQVQAKRNSNHKAMNRKRREFLSGSTFPAWNAWLAQSAANGNEEALAVLRSRAARERMNGNCLAASKNDWSNHFVVPDLRPEIDGQGHVIYKTRDGGVVIDRADHVQCFRTTSGAAQLALELAAKRYKGQPLVVEGSEQFQREVAELAKTRRIEVRFANPGLARERRKSRKEHIDREAQL